ncbi:MAG: hypothetical protein FWE53_04680 [Firmicutes bacterium]|nr:hypothetical protein [Bacillota bacterium]
MARSAKYYRRFYDLRQIIADHFKLHKSFYIMLTVCCVAGLAIGLVSGFRYSGEIKPDNLADGILVKYIKRDVSILALFFTRILSAAGLFLLIWAVNYRPWLCFFTPLVLIYTAFLAGLNSAVLILLFKLGGVINVVFLYIPCQLLIMAALIIWGVVCLRHSFYARQCGVPVISLPFLKCNLNVLIICGAVLLIAFLFETILTPVLTASFFIEIS